MTEPKSLPDAIVAYFRQEFDAVSQGVKKIREEVKRLKEEHRNGTRPPEVLLQEMVELDKRAEFFEARAEQLEKEFEQLEKQHHPTLH